MEKYDSIIIGFGKGGKTLGGYLASKGEKVALIEKSEKMYGGTCINVGCIPSKSLVTSSEKSKEFLKTFQEKSSAYTDAINEKRKLVSTLRKKNFDKLNNNENITIYNGIGSFKSLYEINIENNNETKTIKGDKVFINTGSIPIKPNIEGIDNNPYVFFSEGLMELDTLPKELVIIGGGYISLEFASIYSNFGSNVTIIQHGDKFIPREDDDISKEIETILKNKGINIIYSAETEKINVKDDKAEIIFNIDSKQHSKEANAVLIATGRRANTDDLNLEEVGIETTKRGAIITNEFLETSQSKVWAMGDVVGGLQFTYKSLDDYRIIKAHLDGNTNYNEKTRSNIPFSVFIQPSYSRVGLNEKESIDKGLNIKVAKLPAAAIPKALVLNKPEGLLKAIIDNDTNKILGAMLLCEESYEVINIITSIMDMNADYTVLRDQIFTHPTMSESLNDLFNI